MPKVSAIIATYNRANMLSDAIDSALKQTLQDFELIIVDDGSTDQTQEVVENCQKAGDIRYIYQQNQGRSAARNTGIKVAKGKYIAFLDDDDLWHPNKLEMQVESLENHPEVGLIHTFTEVIDNQGRLLREETQKRMEKYQEALKHGYTYEGMSELCIMWLSSVMVRRECFERVGLFDPNISGLEDWDLYLRIALNYKIHTIQKPLVQYRTHGSNTSIEKFTKSRIQTAKKHLRILDSHKHLPFYHKAKRNFYIHLATAHYMNLNLRKSRNYAVQALKMSPSALFQSRLWLHLALTLLPSPILKGLRRFKRGLQ